jgi:hypothetical protein
MHGRDTQNIRKTHAETTQAPRRSSGTPRRPEWNVHIAASENGKDSPLPNAAKAVTLMWTL